MPLALLERPSLLVPETTDEATRRQFLAGLVALGLLTACGGSDDDRRGDDASPALSIDDDRGQVAVPGGPTRFVTTGEESTELLVALGFTVVGVGSSRVDATRGDRSLDGYYLGPDRIGSPTFVGPGPFNYEAITALNPDLIVHYAADDDVATFEQIAPTLVYDVTVPGMWQEALLRLGRGLDREQQATNVIEAYSTEIKQAKARLAPVAAKAPRITVLYPNYRGGGDNFVFDAQFALAEVFVQLGFDLVGIEKAAEAFPGVGSISLERLGDIETDTFVALGPVDWRQTPAGPILSNLDVPVLAVLLDETRPSTGPLTSPDLLRTYAEALATR
jgi:ABC-type Fe3+-hydroxamate transport system substrate-binding protein